MCARAPLRARPRVAVGGGVGGDITRQAPPTLSPVCVGTQVAYCSSPGPETPNYIAVEVGPGRRRRRGRKAEAEREREAEPGERLS